jgi:hypothetical protein
LVPALFFFLILTPVGLILRLAGKDASQLKPRRQETSAGNPPKIAVRGTGFSKQETENTSTGPNLKRRLYQQNRGGIRLHRCGSKGVERSGVVWFSAVMPERFRGVVGNCHGNPKIPHKHAVARFRPPK